MLNNEFATHTQPLTPSQNTGEEQRWYVFRYRRYSKDLQAFAREIEQRESVQVFLPLLPSETGKTSTPVISSYLFIRTNQTIARTIGNPMHLHPWRKHPADDTYVSEYVIIPDQQMHYFIRAVESKQRNLTLVDTNDIDLQKDDFVRIIKGPMEGATGYLKQTPRSKSAKIIITLDADEANASLSISIDVNKSDVQILRFANNDHLQTLNKRIRPILDDAEARHREGELLPDRTLQRLQAYATTVSATHLTTRHQRELIQDNLRRINTIIGK